MTPVGSTERTATTPHAAESGMTDLPSGTLTFVFTDIEGSTKVLLGLRDRYAEALATHNVIVEEATTSQGGHIFGSEGDALKLVFDDARSAVAAAAQAQRALAAQAWPEGQVVRVRMGSIPVRQRAWRTTTSGSCSMRRHASPRRATVARSSSRRLLASS